MQKQSSNNLIFFQNNLGLVFHTTYSCIFHSGYLLLHFPLLHFPPVRSTPAISTPAFSVAPICDAYVGTTHEEHLVVFITVLNLVENGAVVLIICTFFDFASLAWKRLFTYSRPKIRGFWGFWPPKWGAMWKTPQKGTSLRESASFEPDMHLIWHSGSGRRRNHLWQIFWWSVEGCRFCGGSKIAISHWLSQWPLTQSWRYRAAALPRSLWLTAWRYASAGIGRRRVSVCLSVGLCVCSSSSRCRRCTPPPPTVKL